MNFNHLTGPWNDETVWRAEHLCITARARRDAPTDLVHAALHRNSPDPVLLLASELAAMDGDHDAESLLCAAIADQLAAAGRNDDAAHAWWQTWEAAAAAVNPAAQAHALAEIAALAAAAGDLRRATDATHRRLELLRAINHEAALPVALCDMAAIQLEQGAVAAAATTAAMALKAAGDDYAVLRARHTLGNLHREQAQHRQAEQHYLEAMALARAGNFANAETALLADFGLHLLAQQRVPEASECALRVIAATEGAKHLPSRGKGYELLGRVAVQLGRIDEAINELDCALYYARKHQRKTEMAALLAQLASLHLLRGEFSRACELCSGLPEFAPGSRTDLLYVQPLSLRLLVEAAAAFEVADPAQGAWRLDNLVLSRKSAARLTRAARQARQKGDTAPAAIARRCNLLVLELEESIRDGRDPRIVGGHLPQELPEALRESLGQRYAQRRNDSRRFEKLSMLLRPHRGA
ncbi:MAG: hypothetical protein KF696_13070 [Planctomycetes bacterium]|nr:hypothetical protein [Planctomycetota bacterium]MCW8135488.1 hypothetical protein [Planctomycetota bacterium]